MGSCGFGSNDVLGSAIDALISLSEEEESERNEFEDYVVTSGWDEVSCGWKNTKPNARYVISSERRKRSKEKLHYSPEPDSQLAKVKKLAGMIANSNLHHNSTSKLKTARNSTLTKYQNCGVLSYETPCWRFVIEPGQFTYIERPTFLDLRSANDKATTITHTIILENGGMIRCLELNGRIALFDPAFNFDKHLLDTYIDREEFRLRACQRPIHCSYDYKPTFSQTRTEENKIAVVQTMTAKPSPCNSLCGMCRHRTQDLNEKSVSKSNSCTELKPLLKVTPTQKRVAEDSRLAGKILVHQGKGKDFNLKTFKVSKKAKDSLHSKHAGMRLDWLPITRSTIAYPCDTAGNERVSNDKFPGHTSQAQSKPFAFPRGHGPRARKLTLSEAANLVPKTSRLGHAIDKLAKELESKQEKPLSLSEPLLPSVSGTKVEVSLSSGYCNM